MINTRSDPCLRLSHVLHGKDWADLAQQRLASRSLGVEGMMLKSRTAHYGVGRTKDVGVWWKWKVIATRTAIPAR